MSEALHILFSPVGIALFAGLWILALTVSAGLRSRETRKVRAMAPSRDTGKFKRGGSQIRRDRWT